MFLRFYHFRLLRILKFALQLIPSNIFLTIRCILFFKNCLALSFNKKLEIQSTSCRNTLTERHLRRLLYWFKKIALYVHIEAVTRGGVQGSGPPEFFLTQNTFLVKNVDLVGILGQKILTFPPPRQNFVSVTAQVLTFRCLYFTTIFYLKSWRRFFVKLFNNQSTSVPLTQIQQIRSSYSVTNVKYDQ